MRVYGQVRRLSYQDIDITLTDEEAARVRAADEAVVDPEFLDDLAVEVARESDQWETEYESDVYIMEDDD